MVQKIDMELRRSKLEQLCDYTFWYYFYFSWRNIYITNNAANLGIHTIQAIKEYGPVNIGTQDEWRAFVALIILELNEIQRDACNKKCDVIQCDDDCQVL